MKFGCDVESAALLQRFNDCGGIGGAGRIGARRRRRTRIVTRLALAHCRSAQQRLPAGPTGIKLSRPTRQGG